MYTHVYHRESCGGATVHLGQDGQLGHVCMYVCDSLRYMYIVPYMVVHLG